MAKPRGSLPSPSQRRLQLCSRYGEGLHRGPQALVSALVQGGRPPPSASSRRPHCLLPGASRPAFRVVTNLSLVVGLHLGILTPRFWPPSDSVFSGPGPAPLGPLPPRARFPFPDAPQTWAPLRCLSNSKRELLPPKMAAASAFPKPLGCWSHWASPSAWWPHLTGDLLLRSPPGPPQGPRLSLPLGLALQALDLPQGSTGIQNRQLSEA